MLHRSLLWLLFITLTVAVIIFGPHLPAPYSDAQILPALVGAIWALAFYLHGRHGEDARFLKELMESFNRRYNEMNDALQLSLQHKEPFTQEERLRFIDYFNLCAEEWLYWRQGYIIKPVWRAWYNGMRQYSRDDRVRILWMEERVTDSYYGFEFPDNG